MSRQRTAAEGPHVPSVSTDTGKKRFELEAANSAYFSLLFCSATEAAEPACAADWATWEGANVSEHVKSQIKILPIRQGSKVAPSGLFPSSLSRCMGSSSA